jgi:hypothetical protein
VGAARAITIVSLNFDDARANAYDARALLAAHHMHATFFVPSGFVGASGYMTWAQLRTLKSDGNEIGGHTINHPHLIDLSAREQQRQICNDRVNLSAHGFVATDFAYPYGDNTAVTRAATAWCGYSSARANSGLYNDVPCAGECPSGSTAVCETVSCARAETIPPVDRFAIRTPASVTALSTAADIESSIRDAIASGGGWLNIVFHQLCTGCDPQGFRVSEFAALVTWLDRASLIGVAVRTVDQVIGGRPGAVHEGPPPPEPGIIGPLLQNGSVERWQGGPDVPTCFERGGYGPNTVTFARSHNAHTGSYAEQVTITNYVRGDEKIVTAQDQGDCAPSVLPGGRYQARVWYESTADANFTVFYRDKLGRWLYWTSSKTFRPAHHWSLASFALPPVPVGATALSFGLTIASNGSITTDDYSLTLGKGSAFPTLVVLLGAALIMLLAFAVLRRRWSRVSAS